MTGVIAVIIDSEYRSPANLMKGFIVQGMYLYANGIIDFSLLSLLFLQAIPPRV